MVMSACRQSAQKPVTLSYFRLGWAHADVVEAGHFALDTKADEIAALTSQFMKTQK
jgi:hypothetical protein